MLRRGLIWRFFFFFSFIRFELLAIWEITNYSGEIKQPIIERYRSSPVITYDFNVAFYRQLYGSTIKLYLPNDNSFISDLVKFHARYWRLPERIELIYLTTLIATLFYTSVQLNIQSRNQSTIIYWKEMSNADEKRATKLFKSEFVRFQRPRILFNELQIILHSISPVYQNDASTFPKRCLTEEEKN